MRQVGYWILMLTMSVVVVWWLWGCAPPPPTQQQTTHERQKAIEDSLKQVQEMELSKAYSFALENYKTARTTQNPQHIEMYFRDAIKYFWDVVELDTESKRNLYGKLSDCYTQLDMGDSSIIVLEMGLEKFPTDTYLNQILGYIHKQRGNYENALEYYLVALNNEQENLDFLKAVGELYQKLNDDPKAYNIYTKYLNLNPDDLEIQEKVTNIAKTSFSTEDYIAELMSHLEKYPDDISKRYDLATTYLYNGENEKAIEQYEILLGQDSQNIRALEQMGLAQENLSQYQNAINTYGRILAVDADRKDIICKIALDYIELGNYPKARQKAQQAISQDRNYGQAWVVMGEIHQTSADVCSRGRPVNYYDKLTYLIAYGLFQRAKQVGDFDTKADADRWLSYLSGSLLIPQKEDWFLNKSKLEPTGDCYTWINTNWSELGYISQYLAQFETQ